MLFVSTIHRGQEAPDFTLPGAVAGTIEMHGLSEYTDRGWEVVPVFYPFDFHPACTDRWCSLRDADWLTLLDGPDRWDHRDVGRQVRPE
ncbi:redoxin domain-containing protein [Halomontanus rarus]|uniref:redoxin domain-containing protein n=1 Tax=Halomontanus rarus TaxID=3034020 RepID=UPI0023E88CCD|nr:redoxin domain-containing protein [Halovivax sp. TS33]